MEKKIYYGGEMYHHGILGQRKGHRRYQYYDGTYTEEGKRRRRVDSSLANNLSVGNSFRSSSKKSEPEPTVQEMAKYIGEQNTKKKYYQLKDEENKKGFNKAKEVLDNTSNVVRNISQVQRSRPKRYKPMDLSNMSDQEMRNKINRKHLEEEYIRTFGEEEKRTGKDFVEDVMNNIGPILSATGSLVLIAKAIYDWRNS